MTERLMPSGIYQSKPAFIALADGEQVAQDESIADSTASAIVTFILAEDGSGLAYKIQLNGLNLKEDPLSRIEANDVTKIHFHIGAPGNNGPHALNIFGLPSEDDDDLVVDYENGIITGIWDDGDATDRNGDGDTDEPGETKPLSEFIEALKAGNLYIQVHDVAADKLGTPGTVRGQITPLNTANSFTVLADGGSVVQPQAIPNSLAIAKATFTPLQDGKLLAYQIELDGLTLKENPADRTADNDVTKMHLHVAPEGANGPHGLNIFGKPSEDDNNLLVNYDDGVLTGVWDDGDATDLNGDGDTDEPGETKPLSQLIDQLEARQLYLQVHDVAADKLGTPGTIRGQLNPPDFDAPSTSKEMFVALANGGQVVQDSAITDSNATATVTFILADDGSGLAYQIKLNDLTLKEDPAGRTEDSDVTRIHIHTGERGANGPHTLNIFGLPSEDDNNLVVDYENGVITGIWDNGDATDLNGDGDTDEPGETKPLSDFIEALRAGDLYIQIHDVESDKLGTPGSARGQIVPIDAVDSFTLVADGEQVVQDASVPDSTATAKASFTPTDDGLAYEIEIDGLTLKEDPASRTEANDVTKIHVHVGPEGKNGPHALNVFGLPSEDDDDLVVDYENGIIKGVWDDDDATDLNGNGDTSDPNETKPLSELIDELEAGNLYLQIHDVAADQLGTPGTIRGQIDPPLTADVFTLVADGAQVVQDDSIPDSTASATATFILADDGSGLTYQIKLDGLALKPDIVSRIDANDVTRIHLHVGPEGQNGPHTLNIFGLPSEDDNNLVVDFENGVITGIWDNSDATDLNGDGDTNEPGETKPLSEFLDQLQAGDLYIQIHTVESDALGTPGAIRGQVTPLFESETDGPTLPTPPTPPAPPVPPAPLETITGTDDGETIAGGLGDQIIRGEGGDDVLRGDLDNRDPQGRNGGNDTIFGGAGNDRIGGKGGDDIIYGESGDDQIWGDDGNDIIRGGLGNDTLTGDDFSGGQGLDTFILMVGEGTDTITDFEVGIDLIGLGGGLSFDQLTLSGNDIIVGNEVLATLKGVATDKLTETSFMSL
ncbi:MAG: CHRD domain-containing protein [Cyanobacteria bacterium J06656_5]